MAWKIAIWIAVLTPSGITLVVCIWQYYIRLRLIPVHRIAALADSVVSTYAPLAEHEAFLGQETEWYRGNLFAQSIWMLVRPHLRRRWKANDIELFDAHEVDKILNAKSTTLP